MNPIIELTSVPPYGSSENLIGRVQNVDPDSLKVAVYIFVEGTRWWVKASIVPIGPGPNYFSDNTENVWVDEQDRLHLKITNRDGKWQSSEVSLKDSHGYDSYVFTINGKISQMNENVVLGIFTWDNDACTEFDLASYCRGDAKRKSDFTVFIIPKLSQPI